MINTVEYEWSILDGSGGNLNDSGLALETRRQLSVDPAVGTSS